MSVIFSVGENGLLPVQTRRFEDHYKEIHLQRWADANPAMLNNGAPMISLGMEIPTKHGRYIDNLFLDGNGDLVVAELKRGKAPKYTTSQIIEYAAFANQLTWKDLDALCEAKQGQGIGDTWHKHFGGRLSTISNPKVRLLIVAETIGEDVKDTANYLISEGTPLAVLEFTYFNSPNDRLIKVKNIYGEIPEQTGSDHPEVLVETGDDYDGYNTWLFDIVARHIGQIEARHGWPSQARIGRQSVSWVAPNWPTRRSDLQLSITTWSHKSLKLWFWANEKHAPGIRDFMEQTRGLWKGGFPATSKPSARSKDVVSYVVELESPAVGDAEAAQSVLHAVERMIETMEPQINEFFKSHYVGPDQSHPNTEG